MKAKAWRLYGARDARLEDIELEAAGEEGVVVELVTNTICLSDYKGATQGTGYKRVPKDIATRPTMFGHETDGRASGTVNGVELHFVNTRGMADPFFAELDRICLAAHIFAFEPV